MDVGIESVIGKVADLTPAGFLLVSPDPVETDAVFHLSILLPTTAAGDPGTIEVEAKSLWGKADTNPQLWDTGFELTRLSEGDQRILSRLILDYGLDG